MDSYGPSLAATGGGVATAGLVWGITAQNWVVIAIGLVGITLTVASFIRLRFGEKELRRKN